MKILKNSKALKRALEGLRKNGKRVGFVPTMGYLHEGHLSIVRQARRENEVVAVSIFVNPLQFGPKEDYSRYPRDLGNDKKLLMREKIDILFTPAPKEYYKSGFQTSVSVRELNRPLCGVSRPGHFDGVCTVVLKLLNQVTPDALYLGQKDYQQFCVVRQMIADLDLPVKVRMASIVREPDGLAMSSRNVFLSRPERQEAPLLYQSLKEAEKCAKEGIRKVSAIKEAMRAKLRGLRHGRIDYLEIVDAATLGSVIELTPGSKALAALAVFFGKTRLIDNTLIKG